MNTSPPFIKCFKILSFFNNALIVILNIIIVLILVLYLKLYFCYLIKILVILDSNSSLYIYLIVATCLVKERDINLVFKDYMEFNKSHIELVIT